MAALMTDPQLDYIRKLADKHDVPVGGKTPDEAVYYERFMDALGGKPVSKQEAGWVIDWLKVQPSKAQSAPAVEVGEGVYCAPNGDVIKVKKSKAGHPYAQVMVEKGTIKRLTLTGEVVHFEWTYTPGLIKHLTPGMKLTAEQAMEFGLRFGRCAWCGRALKDADSVAKALGPVCAKRFA